MRIAHIELKEANEFVLRLHRHHKPVTGHRFSIGCMADVGLVGVAICGRPVARALDHRRILEVLRLCTDGTPNACSFLYGASARAGAALGYASIQTYVLASETGTSLKASGWIEGHMTDGGSWSRPSRGREDDQPLERKWLWFKRLALPQPVTHNE